MKAAGHCIEALEPRIAPASVLTFTDVDNDKVKIISSAGDLNAPGVATFDPTGHQLWRLTLTDASFQGASISTVVTKAPGGDGFVNIGRIHADGRDLGSVTIRGDLGALICGDADPATFGLKRLEVQSMGVFGVATQGGGDLFGAVEGPIGSLIVHGDIKGSTIGARSFSDRAAATIGKVQIGGSLIGAEGVETGALFSTGDMRSVKIGGSIIGGPMTVSGSITCNGALVSLELGGSLRGGAGPISGSIDAGSIGAMKIGRDVAAGAGSNSGQILSNGGIGSLTIGGSLVGGPAEQQFSNGMRLLEGQVLALGAIGSIKIRGSVIGGAGLASAEIRSVVSIGSVSVGGAIIGGAGVDSAQINSEGSIGTAGVGDDLAGGAGASSGSIVSITGINSVRIGGSLLGGHGNNSGQIVTEGRLGSAQVLGDLVGGSISGTEGSLIASGNIEGNRIGAVFIGGSVFSGSDNSTAGDLLRNASIGAVHDLGSVTIKGSLIGQAGSNAVTRPVISAGGGQALTNNTDVAIGSVTIGGRVERADILAGYNVTLTPQNGNASIGTVKVGGDWVAGNIAAGILAPPGGFGTGGTVINNGTDAIIARIASITIGGVVAGSVAPGDHFGFTAQQIGAFKAAGFAASLKPGPSNDVVELAPLTGDVTLREI